jgi:hypothetical protein
MKSASLNATVICGKTLPELGDEVAAHNGIHRFYKPDTCLAHQLLLRHVKVIPVKQSTS